LALAVLQVGTFTLGVKNNLENYAVPTALVDQLEYNKDLLKEQQELVKEYQEVGKDILIKSNIDKEDRIASQNKWIIDSIKKDIARAEREKENIKKDFAFVVKNMAKGYGVSVHDFETKYKTRFSKIQDEYAIKLRDKDAEILSLNKKLIDAMNKKTYLTKEDVMKKHKKTMQEIQAKADDYAKIVKELELKIMNIKNGVAEKFNKYYIYMIAIGLFVMLVQGMVSKEIINQSMMANIERESAKNRIKNRKYYYNNKRKEPLDGDDEPKEDEVTKTQDEVSDLSEDAKVYLNAMLHLYNRDKKLPSDAEVANYLGAGWQNKAKRVEARKELLDKEYLATIGTTTKPLSKFLEMARLKEV
jgi:hypothetical protein